MHHSYSMLMRMVTTGRTGGKKSQKNPEIPLDSTRKRMTTVNQWVGKVHPDKRSSRDVLQRCSSVKIGGSFQTRRHGK